MTALGLALSLWSLALVAPREYAGVDAVAADDTAEPTAHAPEAPPRDEPAVPSSPTPTDVAAPAPRPQTWLVGGFVDVAYALSSNFPDNHISRGAVLTPRTGEFTLQTVGLYLDHPPVEREPFRLEIALHAGAAVEALYAGEPVPGGDGGRFAGPDVWKHIARGNAGYRARTGTEIGAGLFASPLGIGGFWSKDNWNYSASWESRAAAFYFAGARVMQSLPAGFGVEGWVVNGFQTNADINRVPSYIAGLTWSDPRWSVAHYVYFGPDDTDVSARAWRTLVSSQFAYTRERFAIAAVWDVGRERLTALPHDPVALWMGGAVFVRGRVVSRKRVGLDLAARPGAFLDRDARLFGERAWLLSGTGTATLLVTEYLLPRLEYRYDHSLGPDGFFYRGGAVTDDDPGLARSQHTVFLSLLGKFELRFATARRR